MQHKADYVTDPARGTVVIKRIAAGYGLALALTTMLFQQNALALTAQSITITAGLPATEVFAPGTLTVTATASSGLAVTWASITPTVCTATPTITNQAAVNLVGAGTCSVTASQAGNATYAAAPVRTLNDTITAASQSITITSGLPASIGYSNTSFNVSATASSGLPVTLASTTTSVCTTVTSANQSTVTTIGLGTCTISMTQAGNANYTAAPVRTQSGTVVKGNQTITFGAPANQTFGAAPFALSATSTSGLAVAFTSATTPVCTVSGSTVTLVTPGTCTINANQAGNTDFNAATQVVQSLTVAKEAQTITFAAPGGKVFGSAPFTVTPTSSSALAVALTSATTSVCTVSGNTVTLVAVGTCTLDANQAGNATYAAATQVAQSFAVTSVAAQTITFGTLSNQTYGAAPYTIAATSTSGLTVAFTSATTGVCTVSGTTLTIVGAGSCTIDANQAGNASYAAAAQVAQTMTVAKAAQTITFAAPATQSFSSTPLTLTATSNSALTVAYTSATTSVCTVAGNAVSFVGLGTCTIDANQAGNTNYNAATQVAQSFTVAQGLQTITFNALSSKAFGSAPFSVAATSTSGLAVALTSATLPVCTVAGNTVTLLAAGTCTLNANQSGNANYAAAAQQAQTFAVIAAAQTITFTAVGNQVYGVAPITLAASSTSSLVVALTTTTTPVCTVSGTTLTIVAAGSCTINANQAGNSNYAAATQVSQTITVAPAAQTITFGTIANQTYGAAPIALTATSTSGLAVTYASTTTPVCTISGSTVTLISGGSCTINATQVGNANYAAATPVGQTFTVGLEAQTITMNAISNQILGVAPLSVTATSTSGLAVALTSATTSVCTVSGKTVTLLAVGSCTINANQAGNVDYAVATQQSQTFTVNPDTVTVSVTNPIASQQLEAPVNLTLTANAVSGSGTITQVAFYNNGALMGTVTQAPYTLEIPNVASGSYVITAKATDSNNVSATSASVTMTVAANVSGELIYYVNTDQLNTPRLLTNSDGIPVWSWDGEAFGNTPPNTNPSGLGNLTFNLRFPGQYYDAETNLHYNGHRDYDPTTGRYIESDPIGLNGGSVSTYSYVKNQPTADTDTDGLAPDQWWRPCNSDQVQQCVSQCEGQGQEFDSCAVRWMKGNGVKSPWAGTPSNGGLSCSCKEKKPEPKPLVCDKNCEAGWVKVIVSGIVTLVWSLCAAGSQ